MANAAMTPARAWAWARAAPPPWALMAALALACAPDFANPTTIRDLRLLVVVADPPEALVDLPAWAAAGEVPPGALPPFTLTALLVDPAGGGRPLGYRAEACGNDPLNGANDTRMQSGRLGLTVSGAPCPAGSALVAEGTAAPGADGVALVSVSFAPTEALLAAAVKADPLGVQLGLPLTVSFVFRAGDEEVVGLKRVLLSPRLAPEQTPNANPRIDSLHWRAGRGQPATPLVTAGAPGGEGEAPPELGAGGRLRIGPSPGDAEAYQTRAFSRSERRFVVEQVAAETLRYAYFTTQGEFSPGTVSTEPNPLRTNPIVDLESDYHAPRDAISGAAEIFVIVRDERGGAGFQRARVMLR
jgi:hypothetical protein